MRAVDELLRTGEAAARLGVSVSLIHRMIRTGRLPATKSSLGYLIDPDDLERLAEERAGRGAVA